MCWRTWRRATWPWQPVQAEAARSPMAQAFTDEAYMAMHLELIHRYTLELRGRGIR